MPGKMTDFGTRHREYKEPSSRGRPSSDYNLEGTYRGYPPYYESVKEYIKV